jgi:hypothetical protein
LASFIFGLAVPISSAADKGTSITIQRALNLKAGSQDQPQMAIRQWKGGFPREQMSALPGDRVAKQADGGVATKQPN